MLWKNVPDRNTGKPRKLPLQTKGEAADSTRPETWAGFGEAVAAAKRRRVDGDGRGEAAPGRRRRPRRHSLGGVDLDGCRDPTTGAVTTIREGERWYLRRRGPPRRLA